MADRSASSRASVGMKVKKKMKAMKVVAPEDVRAAAAKTAIAPAVASTAGASASELHARFEAGDLSAIEELFANVEKEKNIERLGENLQVIQKCLNDQRRPLRILATQSSPKGNVDVEKQEWVIKHMTAYRAVLSKLLSKKKARVQCFVLRLVIQLIEEEGQLLGQFPAQLLREVLAVPLHYKWNDYVVACLVGEYSELLDVRYGILSFIQYEAKKQPSDDVYHRLFLLLKEMPKPPERGSKETVTGDVLIPASDPTKSAPKISKIYERAWIELLTVVPKAHIKETLLCIPGEVFPWLENPLLLADCYLRAFQDQRLDVGVVALSGLFYLLTRSRLADTQVANSFGDQFYTKLYSMLSPELMLLDSERFRRLFMQALNSTMLPATYTAAFAKRALCCALRTLDVAPTLWLLSVAYTLLQKQPQVCRPLIHRENPEPPIVDPFTLDMSLSDAAAIMHNTSAWELLTLKRHWCPQVSRLALLFDNSKMFDIGAKEIEPDAFLDMDFDTQWRANQKYTRRKLEKIEPSFAFEPLYCLEAEQIYQLAFDAHVFTV